MRNSGFEGPRFKELGVVVVVILILIGGILFVSVGRIRVGYVVVVVDPVFGTTRTVGDGASARYYFKPPWAGSHEIYVATDSVDMWTDPTGTGDYPAVESLTEDGLKVEVDVTVRWSISPSGVKALYTRFPGLDWKNRAMFPIIRESIRNTVVNYNAIEIIENRAAIALQMRRDLREDLETEESLSGAVVLRALNLRDMKLPQTFVDSIEAKLSAEQLAIAAEFNKTKILVEANATAQSKILEAEGRARSRRIIANATRRAIEAIASVDNATDRETLTQLYMYLETLRDISEQGGRITVISGEKGRYIIPTK